MGYPPPPQIKKPKLISHAYVGAAYYPNDMPDGIMGELMSLVNILKNERVPGPQLFRLKSEFRQVLGCGGEGRVRGIDDHTHRKILLIDDIKKQWPVRDIAIKNHGPREGWESNASSSLSTYIASVSAEILTLSPHRLRNHPNIVQLVGWGLCLDTLEMSLRQEVEATTSVGRRDQQPFNHTLDSCCFSLQLPLLVLERAEGDFEQFLCDAFTPALRCQDSLLETGDIIPEDIEDSELLKYRPCFGIQQQSDPYELVRLLCVDIGHGLKFLHRNNMTHGDLKPANVLIFKRRLGLKNSYTAKLCDFGHANPAGLDQKPECGIYLGTDKWKLPWFKSQEVSFDTLREYDLIVYGLLVWSAFCWQGNAISIDWESPADCLTRFNEDIRAKSRTGWIPYPSYFTTRKEQPKLSHRLAGRVKKVFSGTVYQEYKHHAGQELEIGLDLRPWKHLYTNRQRIFWTFSNSDGYREFERNPGTEPLPPQIDLAPTILETEHRFVWNKRVYLYPEMKKQVPEEVIKWRSKKLSRLENHDACYVQYETVFLGLDPAYTMGAFYVYLSFSAIATWILTDLAYSTKYYYFARYRACRTRLEDWEKTISIHEAGANVLQKALSCNPRLDICIFAWLCCGEVGAMEVQTLKPSFNESWCSILNREPPEEQISSPILDESEKLDRFLLLLQYGARIEQLIEHPGFTEQGSKSILIWFLLQCRIPTLPVVAREICCRFQKALEKDELRGHKKNIIATSTKSYMTRPHITGQRTNSGKSGMSALLDIALDAAKYQEAYEDLVVEFSRICNNIYLDRPATDPVTAQGSNYENTPLLEAPSPAGWKARWKSSTRGVIAFEERLTKSITLQAPTLQPTDLSRIKIGYLGFGESPATRKVHVIDVTRFLRNARMGWKEAEAFEQKFTERFPLYDDEWYKLESQKEHPRENILSELQDLSSIECFTSRVPAVWHVALTQLLNVMVWILLIPFIVIALVLDGLCHPLTTIAFIWQCLVALLKLVIFLSILVFMLALIGGVTWVSFPLISAIIIFAIIASLGYIPFSSDSESQADWNLAKKIGAFVCLVSPVIATMGTLYMLDLLCTGTPSGRWSDGGGECQRCLWIVATFPFCQKENDT